ncbi:MAG: serine/threonine protein kinase [Betaproteobacteria bacterium]|nr:serine/threonine protein kinase [Betaproteobacteria bacterium]MDH3438814.1 serine/threonine protein kinase [Betaproteobacteria bacterium]
MAGNTLSQLGRYRILGELGHGAMGMVYKAEDPLLGRIVAIKTITLVTDAAERIEYEARFFQEARAAGGLNHPNLITIHDIGREGDIAYMAMELLEGVELREVMARSPVPLPLALDIAVQAAEGLAFAHERGVVHRDIKPGNIMIVRGRHAKIMDFGIARMRASDVKTQTGAILGSPKYMSPEQVAGKRVDRRADIFSLGVVLYELAAGTPPFAAPNMAQLMQQIAVATPRPPSAVNPSLPAMLDLIVARALEKEPDARYQSAAEMAADLRTCLAELPELQDIPPMASESAGQLDFEIDATIGVPEEAERTIPRDPAAALTAMNVAAGFSTVTGLHLALSRRFDSAEGLRQLTALAAEGHSPNQTAGRPTSLARLWRDPDRNAFLAATLTAAVGAFIIAFL